MLKEHYELIILGGGPAGLLPACTLQGPDWITY